MDNYSHHPLNGKHNLDSVVGSLVRFYREHFLTLFLISFGFSLISAFIFGSNTDQQEMLGKLEENPELAFTVMRDLFISIIPSVIVSVIAFVALSYYVLQAPSGVTLTELFTRGLPKFLFTYLIIVILFIPLAITASIIGILLLFIGFFFTSIWLATLFLFLLPALMLENNLIGNAIVSSFRIMHRNLWKSIGWTALMMAILTIAYLFIVLIVTVPFAAGSIFDILGSGDPMTTPSYATNPLFIILSSAASSLLMPVAPIMGFILYFNARANGSSPIVLLTEEESMKHEA